jgi:NAD(P) transhydrogenase
MPDAIPERFDLVVLGSGPAGEKGAVQAAYFGRRVVLVEREPHVGGAGVNTGTIPSKTLRETALYFSGLRQRGLYGVDYTLKREVTIPDFMFRKQEVVRSLWAMIEANIARHRIELVRGHARFEDPHTVRVTSPGAADRLLWGERLLVATGSYPNWPEGVPRDPRLFDSDSVLAMERIPRTLAVVGAGVIGCEYATLFAALGVEVTLISGPDRLLPFLDHEISARLGSRMEGLGLRLRMGDGLAGVDTSAAEIGLTLKSGARLAADNVLFATGRMGRTRDLGCERIGLLPGPRGHLAVNEHYQTALPHVYAAGDVIGFPSLASTSMEQARVAMCHAFDLGYKSRVSPILPMAVYTIPEVAAVGETEESCREKGIDYCVGGASYGGNSRGQIIGDLDGLVKLVFAPADRRLLGVHIVGELASELVHVGQACLHFGGGLDDFIQSVYNYPTLAEAYKYAAYDGLQRLAQRGSVG